MRVAGEKHNPTAIWTKMRKQFQDQSRMSDMDGLEALLVAIDRHLHPTGQVPVIGIADYACQGREAALTDLIDDGVGEGAHGGEVGEVECVDKGFGGRVFGDCGAQALGVGVGGCGVADCEDGGVCGVFGEEVVDGWDGEGTVGCGEKDCACHDLVGGETTGSASPG